MACLCVCHCVVEHKVTVVEIMGNHLFFKSIASQVEKTLQTIGLVPPHSFLPCI